MSERKRREAASQALGTTQRDTKLNKIVTLAHRESGADVATLAAAVGWQAHRVRGPSAGRIKQTLGRAMATRMIDGPTLYWNAR